MLTLTLTLLLLTCCTGASAQAPDISACEQCKERYTDWFMNKRIESTAWTSLNDTKLTADNLCSEAQEIYYDCFQTCVKHPNGQNMALLGDVNAKSLEIFLDKQCMQHECRLADTLVCSVGANKGRCHPEAIDCSIGVLKDNGCNPTKLCHEAERRAYIHNVQDRLNCFMNYPDFVVDDLPEANSSRRGLQVCKDIVMAGCLSSWHEDSENQDFKKFIVNDEEFQENMCQEQTYIQAIQCLINAANGTVTYSDVEYDRACNDQLIKNTSLFVFDSAMTDILIAYEFMCSSQYCKDSPETVTDESGAATDEPETATDEPETETDEPEMTKDNAETKNEGNDTVDKPASADDEDGTPQKPGPVSTGKVEGAGNEAATHMYAASMSAVCLIIALYSSF